MNILMLLSNSGVGGVASCVKSLSEGLIQKGHTVVIAMNDGEAVTSMLEGFDVKIVNFRSKNINIVKKNYKELKHIIQDNRIDIIHCHNRIPAIYVQYHNIVSNKIPFIWSNHIVPLPSDFFHRLLTFYGGCAVAESIAGKNMLVKDFNIPKDKIEIVNLGINFSHFKKLEFGDGKNLRNRYHIEDDEKVILLYGRLDPTKGHIFLLRCLKEMENALNQVKYKLIIPGVNEEFKNELIQYATNSGLETKIIFPGYIKGNEWLSISDLMILPSSKEGFGIVNIESFYMGVPVIRTKTAGYEDMKDLCFGVDYNNDDELSELLIEFFKDDSRFKLKAKQAKQLCDRFSMSNYVDGYLNIYNKTINDYK